MSAKIYDITIIGGGPAGLFGSFYAGLRDAKTKIIEETNTLGGALVQEYPNEVLRDVAGFTLITAGKLAEKFVEQAATYNHTICKGEKVSSLSFDPAARTWKIVTSKGEHISKAVVLAMGSYQNVVKKNKAFADSLAKNGIKANEMGIPVDPMMCTGLPGLYACGDVIAKPKELNFITAANAEAAVAVNFAKKYCNPEVDAFPGYSTDIRKS